MANEYKWVTALSKWYEKNARKLPWRGNHDPYSIWISEVMLQQTQVTTVIPYFHRFLAQFPTVQSLANADEPPVLAAWSGLGYYSRARNLHRGAKYLVEKHRGIFPRTHDEILRVPGIGPYTAGAVLSIAFDLPEPLVDGNVQRVFARFFGLRESLQLGSSREKFWNWARQGVERSKSPRVFNQALMELGATICIKQNPRCASCPISDGCVAYEKNWQTELPLKKVRPPTVNLHWLGIVLESKGKVFLHQNRKGEWWADLWDIPRIALNTEKPPALEANVGSILRSRSDVTRWRELGRQRHHVTHHKINVSPFVLHLKKPDEGKGLIRDLALISQGHNGVAEPGVRERTRALHEIDGRWFSREELENLPLSSLVRKVLKDGELMLE